MYMCYATLKQSITYDTTWIDGVSSRITLLALYIAPKLILFISLIFSNSVSFKLFNLSVPFPVQHVESAYEHKTER